MSGDMFIVLCAVTGAILGKVLFAGYELAQSNKRLRESFKRFDEEQKLRDKYPRSGPPAGCRYGLAPDCGGLGDYRIRDYETGIDVRVRYMHCDALQDAELLNNGTADFELEAVRKPAYYA